MTRFVLICLTAVGLTACKPKPAPEAPPAAPVKNQGVSVDGAADPVAAAPAAPAPPAPDPNTPPPDAPAAGAAGGQAMDLAGSTELDDLSKMLNTFVALHKRLPVDVAEMSRVMGFRMPALPPGARLVIDKENRQVRYVPPGK